MGSRSYPNKNGDYLEKPIMIGKIHRLQKEL